MKLPLQLSGTFASIDKRYIWTSLLFWCYLVYKMLLPDTGLSTTGVEFKQKCQLDSRTSRYKNQLAPPDILLARPSWGQLLKIIQKLFYLKKL